MDLRMRVLLVDDHVLFREGLASLLSSQPDLKVVGEAGDGLEAMQLIKQALPETKIVMLTVHDEDDRLFEHIKRGTVGYLLKSTPHS